MLHHAHLFLIPKRQSQPTLEGYVLAVVLSFIGCLYLAGLRIWLIPLLLLSGIVWAVVLGTRRANL